MSQGVDLNTRILNKFHQLTSEQQQHLIDFMDFLLLKKEVKNDVISKRKRKPALAGTQPFEFLATPEESAIPIDEWDMENDYS